MSHNKSTDFDKLTDTLDRKMLDFNLKFLTALGPLLIKPLALCTEPFFRKNFGQRYITQSSFIISALLWFYVPKLFNLIIEPQPTPLQNWLYTYAHLHSLAMVLKARDITAFVVFVYLVLAFQQLVQARIKRKTGEMWHSLSRGESRFGNENKTRDLLISGLVLVFFGVAAPILFCLFLASICASYYLAAKQQSSLFNRYLDAMDAKIEAEWFQQSLDKGEPPKETDGLYCPLPKDFKGGYRTRVARVVAGGPFDSDAPETRPGNPPGESARPAKPFTQPANPRAGAPSVAMAEPFEAPKPEQKPEPAQHRAESFTTESPAAPTPAATPNQPAASTDLKYKKAFVGIIIILALAIAAGSVVHFWPTHPKTDQMTLANRPASVQSAQPSVAPNPPPSAAPVVQPQQTPPVTAPPATDAGTVGQTDPEAQKLKERQQAVEQITSELTNRVAKLAQYAADCEAKLDTYDGKLASFGPDDRAVLKHNSESARKTIENNLKNQTESLKGYQTVFNALLARPQADPQTAVKSLTDYFARMDKIHDEFTGIFASLDKDFTPDHH